MLGDIGLCHNFLWFNSSKWRYQMMGVSEKLILFFVLIDKREVGFFPKGNSGRCLVGKFVSISLIIFVRTTFCLLPCFSSLTSERQYKLCKGNENEIINNTNKNNTNSATTATAAAAEAAATAAAAAVGTITSSSPSPPSPIQHHQQQRQQ